MRLFLLNWFFETNLIRPFRCGRTSAKSRLLALVYYSCPSLCSMTLSDMVASLGRMDLTAEKDNNVVIVSIDPAEKPTLAVAKKASYKKYSRRHFFFSSRRRHTRSAPSSGAAHSRL